MLGIFEALAVCTFIVGFAIGTFEQIFTPAKYKTRELQFFRNHRFAGFHDKVLFAFALASALFLILHFIFEPFHIYQLFGYVMIVLYVGMIPLFFISRKFSSYMYAKAAKKTLHSYFVSGIARAIFLVLVIVSPILGVVFNS